MSLRARLTVAMTVVLLLVVGMSVTVVVLQRARLIDQLDEQLTSIAPLDRPAAPPRSQATDQPGRPNQPRSFAEDGRQISDVYIAVVFPDGTVDLLVQGQLLEQVVDTSSFTDIPEERSFLTATSVDGSASFRVLHEPSPDGQASTVIALPTGDIDQAVNRLILTLTVFALAIVGILGALAWWVWRLSLIPLARITDTADAIANGERDQRVPELSDATEAGRMARALNTMLDQRDESDDRLRQFVSDASHELRTPLTSIQGYLEIYRAGGFRERAELDDAVRRMAGESERMHDLVTNLLQLARMDEAGQLVMTRTDVGELVRDVCADMGTAHRGRSVTAEAPERGRLTADIDTNAVRQLLTGLVDNALIHGPEAEVVVRAGLADDMLVLAVADDGPGMTTEESARVFDRFYRGDSSRSRDRGGSGLGLAIAKLTAEQHGGRIELDTSPGNGATFTIFLPGAT